MSDTPKQLRRWKHRWGEDDFATSSVGGEFFTVEETEYRKLERENAALRAELEAVRKDAERYRWLRESVKDLKRMVAAQAMFWNNHPSRTKFEAAIDAAIAQGKGEK